MGPLHNLDDSKQHAITTEDVAYFLAALRPVALPLQGYGVRWSFEFANRLPQQKEAMCVAPVAKCRQRRY